MRHRCLCPCHAGSLGDRSRSDGVDVRDPIEAVTACESCLNAHTAALSDEPERPASVPRAPWIDEDGG